MSATKLLLSTSIIALLATPLAAAENVRYFEKDGVTYREVRRTAKRPVVETRYEDRDRTVYREKVTQETRPVTRKYLNPVTRYSWQPKVHGTWNPFAPTHVAYHWVPTTQWEETVVESKQTVTHRQYVPETRTVQVPVRSTRMIEDEVITRTVVNDRGIAPLGGRNTAVARRGGVGGISRLENDPPRTSSDWRSASGTIRR